MSTIILSPVWEWTASVSPPRIAAIEHPLGRNFGHIGDRAGQKAVLRALFRALMAIDQPGEIIHLPFVWQEDPNEPKEQHTEPPIVRAIKRRPWLFRNLISGKFPDNY